MVIFKLLTLRKIIQFSIDMSVFPVWCFLTNLFNSTIIELCKDII